MLEKVVMYLLAPSTLHSADSVLDDFLSSIFSIKEKFPCAHANHPQ